MFQDLPPQPSSYVPLFIDAFAGGGGTSTGAELALGRSPDIAINHCDVALAMHEANHPETLHLRSDVWALDIRSYTLGRKVWGMWASPDCTDHSRAKAGKPKDNKRRGLAWVLVEYCQKLGKNKPDILFLENVPEFRNWEQFDLWANSLRKLGYKPEFRSLKACDFGAPTTRDRLYMIAPRGRRRAIWPQPTHGHPNSPEVLCGHLKPWNIVADIIDWSIPCPSIFLDKRSGRAAGVKRPLVNNTLARIFAGLDRLIINASNPYLIEYGNDNLIAPIIDRQFGQSKCAAVDQPLGAITANGGGSSALVAVHMRKFNPDFVNQNLEHQYNSDTLPNRFMSSYLYNLNGTTPSHLRSCSYSVTSPSKTITAGGNHIFEARTLLEKFTGTKSAHDMITINVRGECYVVTDIGNRMLTAPELFLAQGFPRDYKINIKHNGKFLTHTEQVEKCGNSVSPPVAQAIIAANFNPRTFYQRKSMSGGLQLAPKL